MFLLQISYSILKEFSSLTLMVLPYFVLGVIFGGILKTYLKPEFVLKYLSKGTFSVINASIIGAILPGCACTVMPIADGLKEKGVRLGTLSAFIMIAPLLSPHTVILTYGIFGLKFTVARIIFSFTGAIILGIIFNYAEGFGLALSGKEKEPKCKCSSNPSVIETTGFITSLIDIIKDVGPYFLLGMFIASLMMVFIPKEAIPRYIGSSGIFAYIVATFIGIPVYICEGEEIPITLSLLKLGLGQGPSFTFLMGAVGTCIPTMLMAQKIIGRYATILYLIGWFIFAPLSGFLFSFWR